MILITGSTGNVGRQIVNQLLVQGEKVRVFTRDASKVAQWNGRVEVAAGDFTHPETFAAAADGVQAVFLMNGALDSKVFRRLVAMTKEKKVTRAVFLSTLFVADAASPIGQLHKNKEDALLASGLEAVIVRAGGFMSNAYQWLASIRSEGVVYNAIGDGQIASIHPADIAAVAVHALTTPKITETVYEVTGDTVLTTAEQVAILAKALNRPLRVVDVSAETAVQGLLKNGVPAHVAQALGQSYASMRAGSAARITDTVKRVTGRDPRSYGSWIRENAERFA
jgi:uncharacterized protein YbjT (DUF2867 family)